MKLPADPFTAAATGMLAASTYWFAALNTVARRNEDELKDREALKRRLSEPRTRPTRRKATAR